MRAHGVRRWVVGSDRLILPDSPAQPGWVLIIGSVIRRIGVGEPPRDCHVVDLGDRYVAPGFVDLHVHGGGGAQVNGDHPEQVAEAVGALAAFHSRHGTTSLLATTVSDTALRLHASLRGIGMAQRGTHAGPRILGAHLEGPWLSPHRAGAQRGDALHDPTMAELHVLLAVVPDLISMITIAPELPGALQVIRAAASRGVVMSIGHTDADAVTARAAFDAGARHMTHLFNAMPGLRHREIGPIGVALTDDRVTVEIIADGQHVASELLQLTARMAPGRVVAVTDAMAAAGCADGDFPLGDLTARVQAGRAVLVDAPQTLAGSVTTMDRCVAELVRAGFSVQDAFAAATSVPASVINAPPGVGAIRVGGVADLAILDDELRCEATVVNGEVIWDPRALLDANPRR